MIADARTRRGRWTIRRQLVTFAVIAVGVSWWPWPLTLLNADSTPLVPFGPTVAAIVVTALAGGRRDLVRLLRQLVRWRLHLGWYAVSLLGPVALLAAPVLLCLALGAEVDPSVRFVGWEVLPLLFAVRVFLGGALGEELGWRGWLLPRLGDRYGALAASLIIGLGWAAWHLPLFVSGPRTDQRPPVQFVLWALGLAVVLTWLYERTRGSVLIVTLFHGMVDTTASVLFPLIPAADQALLWWLLVAITTAWAATLVVRGRGWNRPEPATGHLARSQRVAAAAPVDHFALLKGSPS